MSNKHTPGPWVQDKYDFVITPNGRTLLVEGVALSGRSTPETKANARLIAAAPELLEALHLAVKVAETGMCDFNPHDEYVMNKARAAIAKATGE